MDQGHVRLSFLSLYEDCIMQNHFTYIKVIVHRSVLLFYIFYYHVLQISFNCVRSSSSRTILLVYKGHIVQNCYTCIKVVSCWTVSLVTAYHAEPFQVYQNHIMQKEPSAWFVTGSYHTEAFRLSQDCII